MKRTTAFYALLLVAAGSLPAQRPFKGTLYSKEEKLNLVIDLYEETVEVPGMEMFGPMQGYLNGDVYGVWSVTSAEVKDNRTALVRLSNDLGSETQEVELHRENDSLYVFRQLGGVAIKRAVNRKLVKLPARILFIKKEAPTAKP